MPKLPTVAIIGRPNTGKSTLFNRLVGRRKAIVSDIPGTTRDHVASRIKTDAVDYLLVDTGGMGGGTNDEDFEDDVHAQSLLALENADLILFTVNSQEELTASDFAIVDDLRKKRKGHVPVLLVITKCDNPEKVDEILPRYYEFGIADHILPVSANHMLGMEELGKEIIEQLTKLNFKKEERCDQKMPRIAIIGKPNVGKSSIINAFMSDKQKEESPLLVSKIPGTTRDAVDTIIRFHDQEYLFVDTAGIKRRSQTDKDIETFAYFRSIKALEESDIAVLVLDATEPVSKQDKRIARVAIEDGKGLIILLNKIDLLLNEERATALAEAKDELPFCTFAPFLTVSAETRKDLIKIFDLIEMVQQSRSRRIPTKDLNEWFRDAVYGKPMGSLSSSKHITQAEDVPPTFAIFVKNPKDVHVSQLRYLENNLRKTFGLEGTPVRWVTKNQR
ncbi:ribosome biogenesis GTPase Der [Patescibacteria group bacterium]|nr:ribosome biogenesis GTPase Der [Patescibacteria group bacterium]